MTISSFLPFFERCVSGPDGPFPVHPSLFLLPEIGDREGKALPHDLEEKEACLTFLPLSPECVSSSWSSSWSFVLLFLPSFDVKVDSDPVM